MTLESTRQQTLGLDSYQLTEPALFGLFSTWPSVLRHLTRRPLSCAATSITTMTTMPASTSTNSISPSAVYRLFRFASCLCVVPGPARSRRISSRVKHEPCQNDFWFLDQSTRKNAAAGLAPQRCNGAHRSTAVGRAGEER